MRFHASHHSLGVLAIVGLLGCGEAVEGEGEDAATNDIGSLEQRLSANCGTFSPSGRTFTGSVPRIVASAVEQAAGCEGDSLIFDVNDYDDVNFLPPAIGFARPFVEPEFCEASSLLYFVWEKSGANVTFLGSDVGSGSFDPILGCSYDVGSPVNLVEGRDYRFGVSARLFELVVEAVSVGSVVRPL